jgi:sigma-B regulation protein RsbU (phosphoserine phosphatase)
LTIRSSIRYLLVSHGFQVVQAVAVLAVLSFTLTGSRIAVIDRYGNRADIVVSIVVTILTVGLLTAINRRAKSVIDRRFFREQYDARQILTAVGETIRTSSTNEQVLEVITDKISDALHPEKIRIFLEGRPDDVVSPDDVDLLNQLRTSGQLTSVTETDLASGPLLIPISIDHQLNGFISLGERLSGLPYTKEDKLILLVLANQIATFIENEKTIKRRADEERKARELQMAAEVQRHLFPADGLNNDALDIYGICLPALGVGGDYYDYFEIDERHVGVAIADVAGKGIAAALLTSTIQASLQCQFTSGEKSLPDVVSSINRVLQRSTSDGGYATFFLAEFDRATRQLTYVNAGHNPPMLLRTGSPSHISSGNGLAGSRTRPFWSKAIVRGPWSSSLEVAQQPEIRLLTRGGPIIGSLFTAPYDQETIFLESGDILLIYTDGVTEALNSAGAELGEEKLRSILTETEALTARQAAERVIARVIEWQGQSSQHDDITLIVMKVK